MFATGETLKAKKGMAWLIALAALMALIAIGLAVAFAINSASELHSFAAQDDKEAIEAASSSKPTVTNATTQVINLAGLMSLSAEDAVQKIGHGAAVQDEAPMSSVGFTNEETVVLTDEKGDALSGTPTVTLGFDGKGRLLRHRIAPLLHCWDMAISLFPMLLKNFISWKTCLVR